MKVTMGHLLSTAKGCPTWVDMKLRPIPWLPLVKSLPDESGLTPE